MCQKRIPDNDLDNTTGGFSGVTAWNGNGIALTQKEYDELQKGGFIVNGELKNKDVFKAGEYLKKKGFAGMIAPTGYIPMGAKPVSGNTGDAPASITIIK